MSDRDLQLLEAYLDDELSADEVEALRDRLIEEPELATALAEVREARSTRQKVFASMEPGELEVSDMVADVQHAIRGRMRWGGRLKESLRYVAAAACVTIGVMIGSRATQQNHPAGGAMPVAGAGGPTNMYVAPQQVANNNTAYVENKGDTTTISWPVVPQQVQRPSLRPTLPIASPRMVVLIDERGTPIAVQQFDTVAEAREFVEDLRRAAEANGHTILPIVPSSVQGFVPAATPVNNNPPAQVVAEQF